MIVAVTALQNAYAERIVTYARTNQTVELDLKWDSNNYGTVQWQKSTDNGTTWTDISGANKPTYSFKMTGDVLYRAHIIGDKACPPIDMEREIKNVTFTGTIVGVTCNSAEMELTDVNFAGATIVEYGFCANYSALQRSYNLMPHYKVGDTPPAGSEFTMICKGLKPNKSYSIRPYFKTADGAVMYGPSRMATTIAGLDWTSENWIIKKKSIIPCFEIAGYNNAANPGVKFFLGKDRGSLKEYAVNNLGGYKYSAEVNGLEPNTSYLAVATATIDGEEVEIEKTVKTFSDYSTFEVDNTVKPASHAIEWDSEKKLVQLSPEGQQVEYPRMCRVDENKILLTYHGSRGTDFWTNIYMRRSYDNGVTWSEPVIIFDKEATQFGDNYWRIVNPEMTKLQNGWIILTCVGNGKPETNNNCHVIACISKDGGETWGDPIIVGRGRTWEPQVVQLPNGELELLVSSEAAWFEKQSTLYQEIVCARSTDNGETWTEFTRASYNPNCRDGMPVAVVQQGNKGVLFVIECVNGSPSPSVIHRNLDDEWDQADWDRVEDSERWGTPISGGGAPYCIQLPTGEIVVTAHANQTGSVWQTSRPRIFIGDNTGHNFKYGRIPLTGDTPLPSGTGAYYNSLFLKDNDTVWLLITKAKYSGSTRENSAIMYLEGKIVAK